MVKMMMAGSLFVLQMALATSPARQGASETNREAPHGPQVPHHSDVDVALREFLRGADFKVQRRRAKNAPQARAKCYRS